MLIAFMLRAVTRRLLLLIKEYLATAMDTRFNTRTWKHPLPLFWVLFPGAAINELLLGQRVPKVVLVAKGSQKPLSERRFVPCPHCQTLHPSRKWSLPNKTGLGNWFGLYCDRCGGIIPCLMNVFSFLVLAGTFPVWVWFYKPLKRKWLRRQKEKFNHPLNLEDPGYNWPVQGMVWGIFMFVFMGVFYPWASGEVMSMQRIGIGFLWWTAGGQIYGYFMKHFLQFTEKKKSRQLPSKL